MAFFKGSSEKANFKIICPENALKAMFSGHFCRAFSNSSSFKSFAQKKPISRLYARRRPGKPSLFRSGQKKRAEALSKKSFLSACPVRHLHGAFYLSRQASVQSLHLPQQAAAQSLQPLLRPIWLKGCIICKYYLQAFFAVSQRAVNAGAS